ncbi:tetratricopeptide repeat protein [Moheibacter sediminis]|uniref:Tetratricopeptide repeat-containing protein n=1 Tax=Moheibacter sediminis TaxID=1434700 RepID=A0A1W2A7R3_9FLAO|nr:hypothetical protein [Moheibacter sediminis]SMC56779.1 Tetratricopeptide repeat-containing protein [Moheibacter sediminis]
MKNLILFLIPFTIFAQENCNYFKMMGDNQKYEACIMYEDLSAKGYYQFQKEWMEGLDKILEKHPDYAKAHHEKSIPYLKSGDFVNWKINIDKAVKYDAENYLGFRGSVKAKFFGDNIGAIADIDSLDKIRDYDLGMTNNGDYHLNIVKAICYSQLDQKEKAIEIFEKQLADETHTIGLYDYYQLGVTYFEIKSYEKALQEFQKQLTENENAETHYYLGQIYKNLNQQEKYFQHKEKAIDFYKKGIIMRDPYNEHINKVYLETIHKN